MRAWIIVLTILVVFAPSALARPALQDQTALERLPTAGSLGPGWSVLTADATAVTDLAPAFRDAARATYGGPNGARAYVLVLLVAEGMTAVRDSWELSNGYFENYRWNTDDGSSNEDDLEARPLPEGCADGRRTFGTDEVLGEDFPVGISLCAADPDMIILTYASGEVDGQTGYLASDRLVQLVLEHREAGTPVAMHTPMPPTSTPRPTSTPHPVAQATKVPAARGEPTEPDRDISSQTLPLLELLPTQAQMPPGLILADEAERSKAEFVDALGGTDEAAQLLDEWGWSGNAYRDYIADPQPPPPTGTTFLNVSVHRFADAEAANNAMVVFSDFVIFNQGLQRMESPAVGDDAVLLVGVPEGVPLAVLYAQDGPFVYRVGASTSAAEGDPTPDVLTVMQKMLPDVSMFMPMHRVTTVTAVNLRIEPSVDDEVASVLQPGTQLQFLGEEMPATNPEARAPWMQFRTEDGIVGWLPGDLVGEIEVESNESLPTPQSAAAEATIAAQATQIAALQAQQANAQVTATAPAVVVANSVLDPNQQSITIQTDLDGLISRDQRALDATREQLNVLLSRYPVGCRAGFVLISGNAPSIEQGIDVAQRVEALLREVRPDVFPAETGWEHFALPNVAPFGQASISIYFYSGCALIG